MGNFLREAKRQEILALLRLGYSKREIARRTGVKRETISEYGKKAGILPSVESKRATKVSSGSRSLAIAYQDKIERALEVGLTAKRIYQDLEEEGFPGKYSSIKRFVRKIKKEKPEFHARTETPPGREAQIDFGKGAPTYESVSEKYKRPHAFKMVLSFSRRSYTEVIWRQDIESFIRVHENAFRFFGGVPEIIVLDNLKAGVISACFYDPSINPVYQEFAKHYGFEVLPCRVGKPEHKGKVESEVKYVQNNGLKGLQFESLEEQNEHLREWDRKVASLRIHGTTKEQVIKRFLEKEQPKLKLLASEPFNIFKIGKRRVHVDGHIEVEGAYYSVPCEYLGAEVSVHYDAKIVRVYNDKAEEITIHIRQERGRFRTTESHLPENKRWSQQRAEERLMGQAENLGNEVSSWAKEVFRGRGVLAYRVLQGVISLSRKYSGEQLNNACKKALEHKSLRYQTIKILCERQTTTQESLNLKQEDEIIRSLKEYAI